MWPYVSNKGDRHMADYNDPQIVHGGECNRCGQWVRDNEEELFERGKWLVCSDCDDEMGEETDDDSDEPIDAASPIDWLAVAGVITGASK